MEEVLSTPGSGPHSPVAVSGCGITAHTMEKWYLEVLGQGEEVNVIISCSL